MKYTKNDLYIGMVFGEKDLNASQYKITEIMAEGCNFYNVDIPRDTYINYKMKIILSCLNDRTWEIKNETYDIY